MNRKHLINELLEAKFELTQLIEKLEELEKTEPSGTISVKTTNGRTSCYVRSGSSDKTGKYLSKDNREQIKELSQKLFNHKLKKVSQQELGQYEKCLKVLKESTTLEDILNTVPEPLREFVDINVLADKEDAQSFEKGGNYKPNPREPNIVYTSKNGERFKSKSEWMIADMLREYKVPYHYEKPFENSIYEELRSSGRNLYPDFTCFNRRTGRTYYWEHLGMLGDPKYTAECINRIQDYAVYEIYPGSELIISMETAKAPLRVSYIRNLIERFLI